MAPASVIDNAKGAPATSEKQPGHVGHLTAKETDMLKALWKRLFELFKQVGTEYKPAEKNEPAKEAPKETKKGGFFGFGGKKEAKEDAKTNDVFIGTTADPSWLTLPLEKAIPLIPGTDLQTTFWNMVCTDNPDAVVLRFLRARKWDLDAAYNMLINTLRWRIVMRVDDIVALGETGMHDELERLKPGMGKSFVEQLHSGKAFLGGPDKAGRGICFINVSLHHKEDQAPEVIKLLTMFVMETSRIVVHQPIEAACIVFNMDGFTLSNMDFDFVKFLVTCFEAYYPETLGCCLIHKAPWVFSTVWNLITPLLDPVVASKIHFTKNVDELTKYVDMASLPGNISGEKGKKTLDEQKVDPPKAGTLVKPNTPAIQDYHDMIKEFQYETAEWANSKTPEDAKDDGSRLELAKQYRMMRIKSERDLRGPSSYETKGLATITDEHRLIIDFGNSNWTPLDITESV
ncbi:CRAL-TRIO domain-containing protein [Radiomyces spectabilis]|uniref:CRAL-TRIO domain-containing protein n=1 Tax=Radiomyces spectabilis TaxID=64574 RepID=UPI00221F9AAD|nr:CRAL-TRIO domain-containing protein [Radiomyces spectabilis]KAI8367660.1 CRAL-TRIO domain-containing protein [Radiomyces spectabilis]